MERPAREGLQERANRQEDGNGHQLTQQRADTDPAGQGNVKPARPSVRAQTHEPAGNRYRNNPVATADYVEPNGRRSADHAQN